MFKKINSSEFDSKCEDCGNYYASDYLDFHKKERCTKKPFTLDSLSEFQQQSKKKKRKGKVKLLYLPVSENNSPITPQGNGVISEALKEIRKKKRNLISCPHAT